MRPFSCTKDLYREYLLASAVRYSGLALSEVSPISLSHDGVSRWLKSKTFPPLCLNSYDCIDNENVVQGIKYLETRGMIWVK